MRDVMIGVLGHIHTGTTCLAQCLRKAGVSFGSNCNTRLEDYRLLKLYNQVTFETPWREGEITIRDQIALDEEIQAVKHPHLAATMRHWPMLTQCVGTIRSPLAWIKRWRDIPYDIGIARWIKIYTPIAGMDIPMVWFDSPTLEDDISMALWQLGLTYHGGVEIKKRHHAKPDEEIPQETQYIWRQLTNGIQRTCC